MKIRSAPIESSYVLQGQGDFLRMSNFINNILKDLVISPRKLPTIQDYVKSLALPADKHTQSNAEKVSGKNQRLFSNLLSAKVSESKLFLNRVTQRRLNKLIKVRKKLEDKAPWSVGIIIDSTLHSRTSKHIENAQKFNHGQGWVNGHQWTNIGIYINKEFVALPPIPFYTKEESKKRNLEYKTENEKIAHFLKYFSLPGVAPEEIVVLMDSGYDCKEIQNAIITRGFDFVSSLKSSRTMSEKPKDWKRVYLFFEDGRRPWKSIRIATYRGKIKREKIYSFKERLGLLRGIRQQVKLVCSKRSHDARYKYLVCSNKNIDSKTIILAYRHRWSIEVFHRDIKSYIGLEDAGVESFDSLHNHAHYVLIAYNLLKEQ